jgi:cell division protein FtsW (lipid II flippase)
MKTLNKEIIMICIVIAMVTVVSLLTTYFITPTTSMPINHYLQPWAKMPSNWTHNWSG